MGDCMTDEDPSPADYRDQPIDDNVDRIETIISQLENGDPSLSEAEQLRKEGEARIEALRQRLNVGDGDMTVLD